MVPDSCTTEPALHLNTNSSTVQQRTNVAHETGEKRCQTKDDDNQRCKASSDKAPCSSVDLAAKKKRNPGSRSVREASTKSFRRSLRQLEKAQENSLVYRRRITQLSEKRSTKQNIKQPQWLMDPERLEESTRRKLRSNSKSNDDHFNKNVCIQPVVWHKIVKVNGHLTKRKDNNYRH